jgi:hypothetical protein
MTILLTTNMRPLLKYILTPLRKPSRCKSFGFIFLVKCFCNVPILAPAIITDYLSQANKARFSFEAYWSYWNSNYDYFQRRSSSFRSHRCPRCNVQLRSLCTLWHVTNTSSSIRLCGQWKTMMMLTHPRSPSYFVYLNFYETTYDAVTLSKIDHPRSF